VRWAIAYVSAFLWFIGSILKQTKRKHQLTIKTCIKYVDKKSPVMRPILQPKIYKSPVVA
jgi:hypothetical protein